MDKKKLCIFKEGRRLDLMSEKAAISCQRSLSEADGDMGTVRKWTADIWKLGVQNLNGRIYPKELGERLVKEQPITTANDGHWYDLMSGKEYGCAKAVVKNLRIESDVLKADIIFRKSEERYEEKLAELIESGIEIGVSSVGYGEYLPDGKTINPDTYEVVRLLDFVTSPAGEVYANISQDDGDGNDGTGVPAGTPEKSEKAQKAIREMMNRRRK